MFKFRLHRQLLVLTAVPLIGLLSLSGYMVRDAMSTMTRMRDIVSGVQQMRTNDALVAVLQVERGRSNGWLGAANSVNNVDDDDPRVAQLRQEMLRARQQSDPVIAQGGASEVPSLAALQQLRAQIDRRNVATDAVFDRYSGLIQNLMAGSAGILRRMQTPELADTALASLSLTSLTEGAARERGLLNGVIGRRAFMANERDVIVMTIGGQGHDERQFLEFAAPSLRDRYRALQGSALWQGALQQRTRALAGDLGSLDSGAWFGITTERIGSLQKLQAEQFDQISGVAARMQQDARQRLHMTLALAGVAALLTLVLLPLVGLRILRSVGGEPQEVAQIARRIARGELGPAVALRPGDRSSILAAMHDMAQTLCHLVLELQQRAAALGQAAEQLNHVSMAMAQGAQQQASSIEETSVAMRTVSEAVFDNNQNAAQTARIAEKSSAEAREGCMAVSFTVAAMRNVAVSVRHVDEIAYRTNLLAFNAGIEAARAGVEGRGFAVIAGEVRKLAEHAQQAAQEVSEITDQSLDTAEKAGEMLHSLLPSIISTAELVGRISATSQQQARDLAQINAAVEQFSGSLQYSADVSERLFKTAQEMRLQAQGLQELVHFFQPDAGLDAAQHVAQHAAQQARQQARQNARLD